MTEDEAWEELERKQQMAAEDELRREAQFKAIQFIEDNNVLELGIMTLRKAYEVGYRAGIYAEQRRRDASHKS